MPSVMLPSRVRSAFDSKPIDVVRGGLVTVAVVGERIPDDPNETTILLDDLEAGHPIGVTDEGKSFSFLVPDTGNLPGKPELSRAIEAGRYTLSVAYSPTPGGEPTARRRELALGVLRVVPEKMPPLSFETFTPTVVYSGRDKVIITGKGLGGDLRDYALLVDGVELSMCEVNTATGSESKSGRSGGGCKLEATAHSDHQLEITGKSFLAALEQDERGNHQLAIRAGDVTTTNPIKVAVCPYSVASIQVASILLTLLIVGLIVAMTFRGGGMMRVGPKRFANAFLVDHETETYSLGKCQCYLWLVAALLGYLYLALSHSLVQGELDLVSMPDNLLNVLGVSLGTAVGSVVITRIRGPKASGTIHPSWADLISSGGSVAPERVGILAWTMVSVVLFVVNVFQVDPMVLDALPKIPDSLLALSGLTSAGYLGGKLARGAGPVLDEVVRMPPPEAPHTFFLTGRHLGVDATLEVAGQSLTALLSEAAHPKKQPLVITPEDDGDELFAKSLKIVLKELPPAWGQLLQTTPASAAVNGTLTIANSDGQRASANVTLRPAPPPAPAIVEAGSVSPM